MFRDTERFHVYFLRTSVLGGAKELAGAPVEDLLLQQPFLIQFRDELDLAQGADLRFLLLVLLFTLVADAGRIARFARPLKLVVAGVEENPAERDGLVLPLHRLELRQPLRECHAALGVQAAEHRLQHSLIEERGDDFLQQLRRIDAHIDELLDEAVELLWRDLVQYPFTVRRTRSSPSTFPRGHRLRLGHHPIVVPLLLFKNFFFLFIFFVSFLYFFLSLFFPFWSLALLFFFFLFFFGFFFLLCFVSCLNALFIFLAIYLTKTTLRLNTPHSTLPLVRANGLSDKVLQPGYTFSRFRPPLQSLRSVSNCAIDSCVS